MSSRAVWGGAQASAKHLDTQAKMPKSTELLLVLAAGASLVARGAYATHATFGRSMNTAVLHFCVLKPLSFVSLLK